MPPRRSAATCCALASLWGGLVAGAVADPYASAPPYLAPASPGVQVRALVTVGQRVPRLGAEATAWQRFVGIPDGLGVIEQDGQVLLHCNHEFAAADGLAAGPLPSGARITRLRLTGPAAAVPTPVVLAAHDAIACVHAGEPPVVQAPGTRRVARLCSAFVADDAVGFDRPVLLTGEEVLGAATFDGRGGSGFALVGDDLYQLPRFGRAPWENLVVLPGTGATAAVVALEDASVLDAQLYLYVGLKVAGDPSPLRANGLDNGALFVMASADSARTTEAEFSGRGSRVPVVFRPVAADTTDLGLEQQARALGAFDFVRLEDGAWRPGTTGSFWFVTSGLQGTVNPNGRLYRLDFADPADPLAGGELTLVLDGSEGVLGPDNIDIAADGTLMICEDPDADLSLPPLSLARDTRVWAYDIPTGALTPVAEVARVAPRSHALAADPGNFSVPFLDHPGGWETSGVLDVSRWYGPGAWLVTVQAHSLQIQPTVETVQGGQLLFLRVGVPGGDPPAPARPTLAVQPNPARGIATLR
jgi:hypothetical protein